MTKCLAWPVCEAAAVAWLAGELEDHDLFLAAGGPVVFVYSLAEGRAGWRQFAAVLRRIQARQGRPGWILCRSLVPGVVRVLQAADPQLVQAGDRYQVKADAILARLADL